MGKLIGLLLFCLHLLSINVLKKTTRNELALLVMGTIFLVGRAKRAPHWGVQSRFCVIYIYMLSVCRMSVVCQINCVGGITCGPRAFSKSFFFFVG